MASSQRDANSSPTRKRLCKPSRCAILAQTHIPVCLSLSLSSAPSLSSFYFFWKMTFAQRQHAGKAGAGPEACEAEKDAEWGCTVLRGVFPLAVLSRASPRAARRGGTRGTVLLRTFSRAKGPNARCVRILLGTGYRACPASLSGWWQSMNCRLWSKSKRWSWSIWRKR